MKKLLLLSTSLFLLGMTQTSNAQSFNKSNGYMGLVEIGGGIGLGEYDTYRMSLSMINGYRIIPQFAVGVGVGVQSLFFRMNNEYGDLKATQFLMPIFLHLRSDLIKGKVSPFIAFNIGYNLFLGAGGNDYNSSSAYSLEAVSFKGVVFEPTVGVSFNVGQNRMTVGVSVLMNKTIYSYSDHSSEKLLPNIILKVGYSF